MLVAPKTISGKNKNGLLLLTIGLIVAASTTIQTVECFVLPQQKYQRGRLQIAVLQRTGSSSSTSSFLGSTSTSGQAEERVEKAGGPVHVKKAGSGVPMVQSGDRSSFWDPLEEGKLGMDGDLSLEERLKAGTDFSLSSYFEEAEVTEEDGFPTATLPTPPVVPTMLHAAQCWLEHLDEEEPYVPPVFAKANKPVQAVVLGRTKLIEDDAPGDIEHIVMRLPKGFHYVEGQSLSVIPPGIDPKTSKKYKPRLYSIASTRYGDLLDGNTVSLCVRRAEYTDPVTGVVDPTKKGVCSNFLCDVTPGTIVDVAGPVGKTMVLPKDSTKDIIMVATGTGIAPFRSFLHRLFIEHTVAKHLFGGTAWLILGVPTTGSLLYKPEFDAMMYNQITNSDGNGNGGKLKIDYAISREMKNRDGNKLYVQDVLKENSNELFERLENGAVIYFCGLKGMMPGVLDALEDVANERGIDWSSTLKKYQQNHQWHVEVY